MWNLSKCATGHEAMDELQFPIYKQNSLTIRNVQYINTWHKNVTIENIKLNNKHDITMLTYVDINQWYKHTEKLHHTIICNH